MGEISKKYKIDYRTRRLDRTDLFLKEGLIDRKKWAELKERIIGQPVIYTAENSTNTVGIVRRVGVIDHPTYGIIPHADVEFPERDMISSILLKNLVLATDSPSVEFPLTMPALPGVF